MKIQFLYKVSLLCVALVMLACSSESLYIYEDTPFLPETPPVVEDFCTFVSTEQASSVAQAFLGRHTDVGVSTRMAGEEPTITTVYENGVPKIYIVNYPGGGWVIISATKNYYPVLAFSEEGSFEISEDMGGALFWLQETKEAISLSEMLDEESRAGLRFLWSSYAPIDNTKQTEPTTRFGLEWQQENAMWERIGQLRFQHAPDWFRFYPLTSTTVQRYFGNSMQMWQQWYDMARSFGSPPRFTIVAIRNTQQIDPLLRTRWHQGGPFNYLLPGQGQYSASCGSVAMAQIMNFHQHPPRPRYNWNNNPQYCRPYLWHLPNSRRPCFITSMPALFRDIGIAVGGGGISAIEPLIDNARNVFLQTFGYRSAVVHNHNSTQVINEIRARRPVYMRGEGAQSYISRAWVADGVIWDTGSVYYFVEFQNHNFVFCTRGFTSAASPAQIASPFPPVSPMFHMNWGWGGLRNGWFRDNNTLQYTLVRRNLFVSP